MSYKRIFSYHIKEKKMMKILKITKKKFKKKFIKLIIQHEFAIHNFLNARKKQFHMLSFLEQNTLLIKKCFVTNKNFIK